MTEDDPIVVPPIQNEEAEIFIREATQKNTVIFQRKWIVNLRESLDPPLQSAMDRVAEAPRLYDNPGGVRVMNYGHVNGGQPQDLTPAQIDRRKMYEGWRGHLWSLSPISLSVCVRVCQDEVTPKKIAEQESVRHETISKLLAYGLGEYAVLAGWVK